jgi:hypothetical protein
LTTWNWLGPQLLRLLAESTLGRSECTILDAAVWRHSVVALYMVAVGFVAGVAVDVRHAHSHPRLSRVRILTWDSPWMAAVVVVYWKHFEETSSCVRVCSVVPATSSASSVSPKVGSRRSQTTSITLYALQMRRLSLASIQRDFVSTSIVGMQLFARANSKLSASIVYW